MQTHYDVIIVGYGPVGAVTANLLGQQGIRTLVIERDLTPHTQPRAFSCDDEAMRIYQYIGLDEQLRSQMFSDRLVDYTGHDDRVFAEIHLDRVDHGFGFRPLYFFHQPLLEATLHQGVERFDCVTVQRGLELTELTQFDSEVGLVVKDVNTGETQRLTARYILACDGARSIVRKQLNITLKGVSYEEPWLAVSGIAEPGSAKLDHVRFVCNPERPTFVGPAPANQYRLEFMLRAGETHADMENPAKVRELLSPYLDPDRFTIQRAAVYTFHKTVAEQWRADRVFLMGDAAHQMPPFMGQGLVSGLRDTMNLTWKLAQVICGANPKILDSYEQERLPHTEAMADISVKMGYIFLTRNRFAAMLRDNFLRLIQTIPPVREFFQTMKFKPKPIYPQGLFYSGAQQKGQAQGTYFPQPERLDETLGKGFAVIALNADPSTLVQNKALWQQLNATFINAKDVTDPKGRLRNWFAQYGADVAIVRPDRFVYAAGPLASLEHFEQDLAETFLMEDEGR